MSTGCRHYVHTSPPCSVFSPARCSTPPSAPLGHCSDAVLHAIGRSRVLRPFECQYRRPSQKFSVVMSTIHTEMETEAGGGQYWPKQKRLFHPMGIPVPSLQLVGSLASARSLAHTTLSSSDHPVKIVQTQGKRLLELKVINCYCYDSL